MYKDKNYWDMIQEQEAAEEEARWIAKCKLEESLNKPQKRIWTKEEINNLVQTNDTMLYRSLLKLYDRQTAEEQDLESTHEANGQGFNSVDAPFLTSVSQFLQKRGFLTDKQKAATRKKLVKYTGQLTQIANV